MYNINRHPQMLTQAIPTPPPCTHVLVRHPPHNGFLAFYAYPTMSSLPPTCRLLLPTSQRHQLRRAVLVPSTPLAVPVLLLLLLPLLLPLLPVRHRCHHRRRRRGRAEVRYGHRQGLPRHQGREDVVHQVVDGGQGGQRGGPRAGGGGQRRGAGRGDAQAQLRVVVHVVGGRRCGGVGLAQLALGVDDEDAAGGHADLQGDAWGEGYA